MKQRVRSFFEQGHIISIETGTSRSLVHEETSISEVSSSVTCVLNAWSFGAVWGTGRCVGRLGKQSIQTSWWHSSNTIRSWALTSASSRSLRYVQHSQGVCDGGTEECLQCHALTTLCSFSILEMTGQKSEKNKQYRDWCTEDHKLLHIEEPSSELAPEINFSII